jgi:hypothetical protein
MVLPIPIVLLMIIRCAAEFMDPDVTGRITQEYIGSKNK